MITDYVHKGRGGGQSNDYMITGGRGSKRGQNLIMYDPFNNLISKVLNI